MRRIRFVLALGLLASTFAFARPSRASPLGNGESGGEGSGEGSGERRNGLWLALTGFVSFGQVSTAGFIVTGAIPLDALATRSSLADPPVTLPPAPPPERPPKAMLTPALARDAVSAAWRNAHVAEDGRFTALATRARASALLPEVRFRVMRMMRDGPGAADTATSTPYSLYYADRTVLEGRVLFRFERLVFADEEVAIERLRADALIARERIAHRVLEELGKWQRAQLDLTLSPVDSAERMEAALRQIEAESALDVLTGGWFGNFLATHPETP